MSEQTQPLPSHALPYDDLMQIAEEVAKRSMHSITESLTAATGRNVIVTVSVSVDSRGEAQRDSKNMVLVSNVQPIIIADMMLEYAKEVLKEIKL